MSTELSEELDSALATANIEAVNARDWSRIWELLRPNGVLASRRTLAWANSTQVFHTIGVFKETK